MSPRPKLSAKEASEKAARLTKLSFNKLRGGYYTSDKLAAWLCAWAIRDADDYVLEPSCGDGVFLEAAIKQLKSKGAKPQQIAKQLRGIEISPEESTLAQSRIMKELGLRSQTIIKTDDFFSWWNGHQDANFDAVIGNPPFIRYQNFPEPHRTRAMKMMGQLGLTPNRLTNIWVPFVVGAAASLRVGGRLAFVLPAELLQVTYAAQLRSFLNDRFERIDIVSCNELFFENAEQEIVLLLADGALAKASQENICRVAMTETKAVSDIVSISPLALLKNAQPKEIRHDNEKWLKYFLKDNEISFMRRLREAGVVTNLSSHASVDVGVVTGKNEFFVLSSNQVSEFGLEDFTIPLVSRSVQLKGARISKAEWKTLAAAGDRVHLLDLKSFNGMKLSGPLAKYIKSGERKDIHTGFKCSVRTPWYAVPSIWTPDGFMFRQIYDFPRLVLNQAGATSTDTIHRMKAKTAKPEHIIANTYTWLTAASAEIEGRSYGGGVLELEPTEAERLLMPAELNGAMPLAESDRLTRAGKLNDVLEENARIVLMGHLGLSRAEAHMLRDIWFRMRDRRMARRRRGKTASAVDVAQ